MTDTATITRHELPLRTIGKSQRGDGSGRKRGANGHFLPAEAPPEPEEVPADFVPVRVWTAGPGTPQEKIVIPGTTKGIRPGPDGAYVCRTPRELEAVKRAVGEGRFWKDNIPEDERSLKCEDCGWTTRNYHAYQWHTSNAHGRAQTN